MVRDYPNPDHRAAYYTSHTDSLSERRDSLSASASAPTRSFGVIQIEKKKAGRRLLVYDNTGSFTLRKSTSRITLPPYPWNMVPTVHKIDPNADTIITLKNACTDFAPWQPALTEPEGAWASWVRLNEKRKKKAKEDDLIIKPQLTRHLVARGRSRNTAAPSTSEPSNDAVPSDAASQATEPEQDDVYYHVSSRHLMLASPMFKRALDKDGFKESIPHESDGFYHIDAHDWDPEAFLIVMQIIHGRNRNVPRVIPLEMLAKIAVVEDYYHFGEGLEIFQELWLKELKKTDLPTTYCRDLVLWIWVAWTFSDEEPFLYATFVAITHAREAVSTLDLPIPSRVIEKINSRRQEGIEAILSGLHNLLKKYRSSSYICPEDDHVSFACGSFLLGALTKGMDEKGLIDPPLVAPFTNMSCEDLCDCLDEMRYSDWASLSWGETHSCTLNEDLIEWLSTMSIQYGTMGFESLQDLG
ncbi:hypothetical protein ACJQWK_03100 [Exserohilum turcicum]